MKILVIDTTGATGRDIVKQAVAQGHAGATVNGVPSKLGGNVPIDDTSRW
jgi:hypothetical protein